MHIDKLNFKYLVYSYAEAAGSLSADGMAVYLLIQNCGQPIIAFLQILCCDSMQEIKFDPKKTALVVIDMQKGIAAGGRSLAPHAAEEVRRNVGIAIRKFRDAGAKVFLVHVTGTDGADMLKPLVDDSPSWGSPSPDWAEFVDEAKPTEKDIVITKRQWGAFYGTELDLQLRRRHIDTIFLCGISTNIGVETTAREAYQHGYNVVLLEDAMSAMSRDEHDASVKFVFPRIGIVRSTEQAMSMLG